jgi:hypothetical protein
MASTLRSFERRVGSDGVSKSKSRPPDQLCTYRGSVWREGLTGRDLAEIVDLLKRKLSWYGFRSIALGPVIKVQEQTISVDLMDSGVVVGRVEVDRRSGVIKRWLPLHLLPDRARCRSAELFAYGISRAYGAPALGR